MKPLGNNQMMIIFAVPLERHLMYNDDVGLNDRVELLEYLKFLLRNEEQFLSSGWYSESDFYEEVFRTVKELAENLQGDE